MQLSAELVHQRIENSRNLGERDKARKELTQAWENSRALSQNLEETRNKLILEVRKGKELGRSIRKLEKAFNTVMGSFE